MLYAFITVIYQMREIETSLIGTHRTPTLNV